MTKKSAPYVKYARLRKRLLAAPEVPVWVQELIPLLDNEDPWEVVHGLEVLLDLFEAKAEEAESAFEAAFLS